MDTLRGNFDPSDISDDAVDYDLGDEDAGRDLPPAAIGQDERRMQVRAYNHWAGALGDRNFPSIDELEPEKLEDFGPYGVLLDFSHGIEDPAVQFVGEKLAEECGTDDSIVQLSDVPSRSLLSRITDHYMQILANQAPIGFEAEFVNQRGLTILYRGILLPYSSDDDTIDFIYGVINWKEIADQVTADELLLEIDQALDAGQDHLEEEPGEEFVQRDPEPIKDWADGPASEDGAQPTEDEGGHSDGFGNDTNLSSLTSLDLGPGRLPDEEDEHDLPLPDFGQFALEHGDEDEEEDEANYDFASLTDHVSVPNKKTQPIDLEGVEPFATPEDAEDGDAIADHSASDDTDAFGHYQVNWNKDVGLNLDAAAPFDGDQGTGADDEGGSAAATPADASAQPRTFEEADEIVGHSGDTDDASVDAAEDQIADAFELDDDAGLHDCLAAARELAQNARSCEDRSRSALYAAVSQAYDFSLAAQEEPEEFEELVAESGLTVQERAPMTPIVKLVFGADYDKTRLTEYAAVLGHAHRVGIERGTLARFLAEAEGGLKGVVTAERRLRREDAGKPVETVDGPREALAKKLRAIAPLGFEDIDAEGEEFALVMIRRTPEGEVVVLGEIERDIPLIERAARKLVA